VILELVQDIDLVKMEYEKLCVAYRITPTRIILSEFNVTSAV